MVGHDFPIYFAADDSNFSERHRHAALFAIPGNLETVIIARWHMDGMF